MALFTIEQVELIRRLRNSGITKEQVLEAFDQLEKLESERFSPQSTTSFSHNALPQTQSQQISSHLTGTPSYCGDMSVKSPQSFNNQSNGDSQLGPENCELEELKKKGDSAALSEIRHFVMKYNIKQTMIADMTRMSQAYVSRFFRGDIQDLPERTKNTFYLWYLNMKHNPWALANMCTSPDIKKLVNDSGDLIPLRRERFTFKSQHLAILERYYEKDPYPDVSTRELIVEECNRAVQSSDLFTDGRIPSERETVTLPVVNNWFNNRRKEAKKRQQLVSEAANTFSMASWYSPYNTSESNSPGFSPEILSCDLEERLQTHIKQEA